MRSQLWMDSENGGLDPEVHSPLEFAFLAVKEGKIVDRLKLTIRAETMVVTFKALQVNKQDLLKDGYTLAEAKALYLDWMNKNFYTVHNKNSNGGPGHYQVIRPNKDNMPFFCGHNTRYDRPFLQKLVGEFDYVYYHTIDTMMFANILLNEGLLPEIENLKLETISNYLMLPPPERFHDALMDVEQTFKVYQDLRRIMRGEPLFDIRARNQEQLKPGPI